MSDSQTYLIAEIGLNHNGSLNIARELIDVAASAGVNAVKFQKRTIENLAIASVLDAEDKRFPNFGKTYREIRTFLEFDFDDYLSLRDYSESKKLDFIVTPFDIQALSFLEPLELSTIKIASHSVTNLDFLEAVAKTQKHIIMSTGMSYIDEIDRAVDTILAMNNKLSLLHCVSSYPTPLEHCNLRVIRSLSERYGLPVGYSGHEQGYIATLASVAVGATIVERHITLDKKMEGFDHKLSLEPNELCDLVARIRDVEMALGNSYKDFLPIEQITRDKYNVSMVALTDLREGHILQKSDITWKNPGSGIPPKHAAQFIGKRLNCFVPADHLLTQEMFL